MHSLKIPYRIPTHKRMNENKNGKDAAKKGTEAKISHEYMTRRTLFATVSVNFFPSAKLAF